MVRHRGPDGDGWTELASPAGPVCLGHRRLAILDVSDLGLQPMQDTSGRYSLIFNGEIYNYRELAIELVAKGCMLRTKCDSEVLLYALIVWGESALDRLRGMFSFLFWDNVSHRLLAVRDRFGIKPLYFTKTRKGIAFASEIKQLLNFDGQATTPDSARVTVYLTSGISDDTNFTMFAGIEQVPGGMLMIIDASNPELKIAQRRWYKREVSFDLEQVTEREAAKTVRGLLQDSVMVHLRADVKMGSCLSGGLDSSAIVGMMHHLSPGTTIETISACYPDHPAIDEARFAGQVAQQANATPHIVTPRAEDLLECASDIIWHQDEPFGSLSVFAQWVVYRAAKNAGLKVMLDGQGADETMGGYRTAYAAHAHDLIRRAAVKQLVNLATLPGINPAAHFARKRQNQRIAGLVNADINVSVDTEIPENGLGNWCVSQIFERTLPMLLHWQDRNSMAHSVEARVPFLDHALVEFALRLGSAHKIAGYETKLVLRRAVADLVPASVLSRRDKIGFGVPDAAWLKGPLYSFAQDAIDAALKRFPTLLNQKQTRAFVDAALHGKRPVDFTLWRIINLGLWGECFDLTI